jgi:hypothetical protein
MRGRPGTRRNDRGDRSFIEASDRWKRWPSFFHRLNQAGRRWTMVFGEYKDEIDTVLIPPGTQYGATRSNSEQRKRSRYAGIAIPCTPLQRLTDHSYLASRRFESARRLCTIGFIRTLCQRAGHGRLRVSFPFPGDPREEL